MSTAEAISLTGATGNYFSTPDSAGLSVTGDIDIRVKVLMNDWTPTASPSWFVSKYAFNSSARSYRFGINSSGTLAFHVSSNGTAAAPVNSSVATGVTDGTVKWLRVTRTQTGGTVTFYTSNDGSSWTTLGTTQTALSGSALHDNASSVQVAADGEGGNSFAGKLYYAEIRNGVAGTVVGKFDPSGVTIVGTRNPTTYSDGTNTWTASGSAWDWYTSSSTATGTAALTLPGFTASGSATFTQPTYTATAALTTPAFTATASGTFTSPVYTGSATATLPGFTANGTGSSTPPTYTATASLTVPAFTATATATFTPVYTGTAALSLPAFTASGTGTYTAAVPNVRGYSAATVTASSGSTTSLAPVASSSSSLALAGASTATVG